MKSIFSLKFLVFLGIALLGFTQAADLSKLAPDFTLKDANGVSHKLSDLKGKYVVLEWINYDCPFVAKHYKSGNMQSLQKKYTEQGVIWFSICSSAPGKQGNFSPDQINTMKKEKNTAYTAYLIDDSGQVGKLYDAKTTPHMYIINPEGILIYAGAIDDKKSTDIADVRTAQNYVSSMLDAALEGKEVQPISTTAYGCSIKY